MLVQKELERLFQELITKDHIQFYTDGSDISVTIFDYASKLSLTTPVYFGGNYIPKSVRVGVQKIPPFEKNASIKTALRIDEDNFRVFLTYVGVTDSLNSQKFQNLIEEFCMLADQWKIFLDEHDKDDLIYIHSR